MSHEFVILRGDYRLVTLNVIYFMPMAPRILQQFLWQTMDERPKYPRIEQFLDFWRREIDAVIKDVIISDTDAFDGRTFRKIEGLFDLQ